MGVLKKIGDYAEEKAKSSTNTIISAAIDAAIEFGKSAIHAVAPDDFEYYLCSLELYNSNKERKGFLSFVVMPDQMVESQTPIQTIVRTNGGVVTTFNPSFAPRDITISGTFGKKFRIISNFTDPVKKRNGFFDINFGKFLRLRMGIKSGYGLTKILQHILQTANSTDENGKPYFLCFNNYALNTHYLVNVQNFQFTQSMEQNMIWYYNIALKAVANRPRAIDGKKDNILSQVASNAISNGLTKVVTNMIGF